MAFEWKDVLIDAYQEIDAERAAAYAELESARQNEDANAVRWARNKVLDLDVRREKLDRHSNRYAQSLQNPQVMPGFENYRKGDAELAAKYGLTPNQFDHATCWTDSMPKEQRIETYIRNHNRYQELRNGGYRDEADAQAGGRAR